MNTVTVNASKAYCIHIGKGLLSAIGQEVRNLGKVQTVCIVSETNVFPLYGQQVRSSLEDAGFSVISFVFPAGESQKNGSTYLQLLTFLAENNLSRTDLIVALGGGVVGDLAGFAAATYLRGIRFVQLPTTLLAAVDSSVGGKTAIDLPAGKNLAGAFCQPDLVLCDIDTLSTLPEDIFRDGCAEIIKYGVLYDPELFSLLEKEGLSFDREAVITRCIQLKRDVVQLDERDVGPRMKLNLGHTIGHGIEKCSNYTISHGQAVAIGMAVVTQGARIWGHCTERTCNRILKILEIFSLPTSTCYDAEALYHCALSDKKRTENTVNLIIPKNIGECVILPTPADQLKFFIEAGL